MSTYMFSDAPTAEQRRLGALAELFDEAPPATSRASVSHPGWRCWEVGAGSGSIAAWLAEALRPGGWLLIEDVVMMPPASCPPMPVVERVIAAFTAGFRLAGARPEYGLALPGDLAAAGLVEVDRRGRVPVIFLRHTGRRLPAAQPGAPPRGVRRGEPAHPRGGRGGPGPGCASPAPPSAPS